MTAKPPRARILDLQIAVGQQFVFLTDDANDDGQPDDIMFAGTVNLTKNSATWRLWILQRIYSGDRRSRTNSRYLTDCNWPKSAGRMLE